MAKSLDGIKKLNPEDVKKNRKLVLNYIGEKETSAADEPKDFIKQNEEMKVNKVDGIRLNKPVGPAKQEKAEAGASFIGLSFAKKNAPRGRKTDEKEIYKQAIKRQEEERKRIKEEEEAAKMKKKQAEQAKKEQAEKERQEKINKEKEMLAKEQEEKQRQVEEKIKQAEALKREEEKKKEIALALEKEALEKKRREEEKKWEEKIALEEKEREEKRRLKEARRLEKIKRREEIKKVKEERRKLAEKEKQGRKQEERERRQLEEEAREERKKKLAAEKAEREKEEQKRREEARKKKQQESEKSKLAKKLKQEKERVKRKAAFKKFKKNFTLKFKAYSSTIKRNILYIFSYSILSVAILYLIYCLLVLRLNLSAQAINFLPAPAVISNYGIVSYQEYNKIKNGNYSLLNPADRKNFLADWLVKRALKERYQSANEISDYDLAIKFALDKDFNNVGITRINKISYLLKNNIQIEELVKYADDYGFSFYSPAEAEEKFGPLAAGLGINQYSPIIIKPEGYYIIIKTESDKEKIGLKHVYIKARTLDEYLNERLKKSAVFILAD